MMANNMPAPPMRGPQLNGPDGQLYARILEELRRTAPALHDGWQSTIDIRERALRILELVTQLRYIGSDPIQNLQVALHFESRTIQDSPNREVWASQMDQKKQDIFKKRAQQGPPMWLNPQMNMPPNAQLGFPNNGSMAMQYGALGGMSGMAGNMNLQNGAMNLAGSPMPPNQNPMMNANMRANMMQLANIGMMPQQQPPQQQLQAPNQHQPQPPSTLDPASLQVNPSLTPAAMGPSNQATNRLARAVNGNVKPNDANANNQAMQPGQPPAPQSTDVDGPTFQEIANQARKIYDQMPDEQKGLLRTKLMNQVSEQNRPQLTNTKGDPLLRALLPKAREILIRQRNAQFGSSNNQQPNLTAPPMGNSLSSMSATGDNAPRRPNSQPGGPSVDYSAFLNQQQEAMRLQGAGELVVSNTNNPVNPGNKNLNMSGLPNDGNASMANHMNLAQNANPQMLDTNKQMQFLMQRQMMANQQREQANKLGIQTHANQTAQQMQQGAMGSGNTFAGNAAAQRASPALPRQPLGMPQQAANPNGAMGSAVRPPNMRQANNPPAGSAASNMNNGNNNNLRMPPNTGAGPNLFAHLNSPNAAMLQAFYGRLPVESQRKFTGWNPDQLTKFMVNILQRQNAQKQQQQQQQQLQEQLLQQSQPQQQQLLQQGNGQPGINMSNLGPANNPQQQLNPTGNAMAQTPKTGGMVGELGGPSMQGLAQAPLDTLQMQQRLHAQQMQQQHHRLRAQALDACPFPRDILNGLNLTVPGIVQTWHQLKQHVLQNAPPELLHRVVSLQQQWFYSHPNEAQAAVQRALAAMRQALPQQGLPGAAPSFAGPQPDGQAPMAPTAPMLPPNVPNAANLPPGSIPARTAIPPGMMQMLPPVQPATPQDIQVFRETRPQAVNLSDEQIRSLIGRRRQENQQRAFLAMQQQRHLNAGRPPNQQVSTAAPAQGLIAPGMGPQQFGGPLKPPMMPPTTDDSMDSMTVIPPASSSALQATPLQLDSTVPGLPSLTPEQLSQLPRAKRDAYLQRLNRDKQRETLRQVQQRIGSMAVPPAPNPAALPANTNGNNAPPHNLGASAAGGSLAGAPANRSARPPYPPAARERLAAMQAEAVKANPKGNAVQYDAPGLERAKDFLRRLWLALSKLEPTMIYTAQIPAFDDLLKDVIRARVIVHLNAADGNGNIKDYLSVTLAQLAELETQMTIYFDAFKAEQIKRQKSMQQPEGLPPQPAPAVAPSTFAPPAKNNAPGEANATGKAPNHARKVSAAAATAASKVPPAPTDANKTFDYGPSPQGVPKYEASGAVGLNLKMPPNKKRKTGQPESQASTPAAAGGAQSPSAANAPPAGPTATGKTPSPDQKRKPQPQPQPRPQPSRPETTDREAAEPAIKQFRCADGLCEASVQGFDSEAELCKHEADAHQPVDDPLKFLLDTIDAATAPTVGATAGPSANTGAHPPNSTKPPLAPNATSQPQRGAELATNNGATAASAIAVTDDAPPILAPKPMTLREAIAHKHGMSMPTNIKKRAGSTTPTNDPEPWTEIFRVANPQVPILSTTGDGQDVLDEDEFMFVDLAPLAAMSGPDWERESQDLMQSEFFQLRPADALTASPTTSDSSVPPVLTPSDRSLSSEGPGPANPFADPTATEALHLHAPGLINDPFGTGDNAVPERLLWLNLDSTVNAPAPNETIDVDNDTTMRDADNEAAAATAANSTSKPLAPSDLATWVHDDTWDFDHLFGANAGLGPHDQGRVDGNAGWVGEEPELRF